MPLTSPPEPSACLTRSSISSWPCSTSYETAPYASSTKNFRVSPRGLNVAGRETLVSTTTSGIRPRSVGAPADACDSVGLARGRADLLLAHVLVALVELLELRRQVVVTAKRGEQGALRDPVAAARQLDVGDALRLDPAADRPVAHAEQARGLGDGQQLGLCGGECHRYFSPSTVSAYRASKSSRTERT